MATGSSAPLPKPGRTIDHSDQLDFGLRSLLVFPPFSDRTAEVLVGLTLRSIGIFTGYAGTNSQFVELLRALITKHAADEDREPRAQEDRELAEESMRPDVDEPHRR